MNLSLSAPAYKQETASLAGQAKLGNQTAFSQLCLLYERDLYAVSYCILQNHADCADAVQEALIKAYTKIGSLRHPQYFKTWLTRILINESNRLAKRNRPTASLAEEGRENAYDGGVKAAIASLPDEQRLVLVLRYHQGYKVSEIAKMLHIPEGTVKSRAAAARKNLAVELEDE